MSPAAMGVSLTMQQVLAVVIGVSFLFLALSLIASAAVEVVSAVLRLRANMLQRTIVGMLTSNWAKPRKGAAGALDATTAQLLEDERYAGGYPGFTGRGKRPSYLKAETFAELVLHHFITPRGTLLVDLETRLAALAQSHPDLAVTLDRLATESAYDLDAFRQRLGHWFDDTMDRVSGWYRRRVRWMLGIAGALLAVGMNISVLHTASAMWTDPLVRDVVVAEAQRAAEGQAPATGSATTSERVSSGLSRYESLTRTGLPIGWKVGATPHSPFGWLAAGAGWLIVALGVSMGAPFWFDLLGRFVHVRLTGITPAESAKRAADASARQAPPPAPLPIAAAMSTMSAPDGSRLVSTWDPSVLDVPAQADTAFTAAEHGFAFDNDFVNSYPAPIPGAGRIVTRGRCGGMVFAALDFFHASVPCPTTTELPADGTPLGDYLMARLLDSWARVSAVKFVTWSLKNDRELATLTEAELEQLLPRLAHGAPTPLGLISARRFDQVGLNHQVLATGYELLDDGSVRVRIYDNNTHGAEVTLTVTPGRAGIQASNRRQPWRALFIQSYSPRALPADLAAGAVNSAVIDVR